MKIYDIIVEAEEPAVPPADNVRQFPSDRVRGGDPSRTGPARTAPVPAETPGHAIKSMSYNEGSKVLEIEFENGRKLSAVADPSGRNLSNQVDELAAEVAKTDPATASRITATKQARLTRLTSWFGRTRIGRWLGGFARGSTFGGIAAVAGAYHTFTTLLDGNLQNHAALDTYHRLHMVQSRSQEIALRKAREAIDTAFYVAIGAEIVSIIVSVIGAARVGTRGLRLAMAGIPLGGWIGALISTAIVEGLGMTAAWAINKYGPQYFAQWMADEWSSMPVQDPSQINMGSQTFDIDDQDFNAAVRQDRANGASRQSIDAVRDQAMQGIDQDAINNAFRNRQRN